MECAAVTELPQGQEWTYEIKLDGHRAQAIHTPGGLRLLSRNGKDLGARYPEIVPSIAAAVPSQGVVDGELVAVDERGHPNFQLLQNAAGFRAPLMFFAFDLLTLGGRDLTRLKLSERRLMLREFFRNSANAQISESYVTTPAQMISHVRRHGLEGVVAKRTDSRYETGARTGSWVKLRIARAQEFVIGGFTTGSYGFDSLIVGFYRAGRLLYCARVRNGFVPAVRRMLYARLWPLITSKCPFANLPEKGDERWGPGITAERMRECVWVRPELVGQFGFLEWTASEHLRHARFLGLRDDKASYSVVREL